MGKLATAAMATAVAAVLAGCPDNPHDVDTWTEKLSDHKESEVALTRLAELCNPKAIPAIGKAWERDGRPARHLDVMIDLARPLTPAEADEKHCTDFTKKGRDAGWDAAFPFFKTAVEDLQDVNSQREVDAAAKAAKALGESMHPEGLDVLINAVNRKMDPKSKGQNLRREAIVALSKYKDKRAVDTLANVIRSDTGVQPPAIVGAAINALGQMRTPAALPILLESMYRQPLFFAQTRRSLIAVGGDVKPELRKILKHEHGNINALFQDKKLDKYCGQDEVKEKGAAEKGEKMECEDVSAMDFYAAYVIGDLYDKEAVPVLLEALKRPVKPGYFAQWNPGPPAHNAVLDALRKIGDPESAQAVIDIVVNSKDERLRAMAASVYGFVSTDGSEKAGKDKTGLKLLGEIAADNNADQGLRLAAAESFGRIAATEDSTKLFRTLAKKYADASEAKRKEADGKPKTELEAATKKFDDAKTAYENTRKDADRVLAEAEAARKEAIKKATAAKNDEAVRKLQNATASSFVSKDNEEILLQGIATKTAFDKARDEVYKPAKEKFDSLDSQAKGYKGYQRGFENHIARVEVAIHCAGKVECLIGTFDAKADVIFERLQEKKLIDVKDPKDWSEGEREDLKVSQIERAVLELRRLGPKAAPQLSKLLDKAKSPDRLVRQSVLLAVPRIASLPCDECLKKLDEAIAAGQGKQELAELNYETELVRDYYSWAK
jgi:HEAT repeat protein